MQRTKFGNLLKEVKTGIIVHGCNDQGVMGSGFAKELRETYPEAYKAYVDEHAASLRMSQSGGWLELGTNVPVQINPNLWVVNAITQHGFGRDGKRYVSYEAIHQCFEDIAVRFGHLLAIEGENLADRPLEIHYPLIGAGLGGGDWAIIQACIDSAFGGIECRRNLWILDK
jgi:O-acetyl-ADP-ribose deacetylase (regulator of RNase III)